MHDFMHETTVYLVDTILLKFMFNTSQKCCEFRTFYSSKIIQSMPLEPSHVKPAISKLARMFELVLTM